ncbi:flagellar type III secretion system protein FlhB [Massilia sp. Dwa41.01b]|uniref:flagellar type III secretion system protein FlhB n=1 Tax=unclassified Massilia TaxID=2609279 RepID=UPI0015FFCCEA|nr:MULTISPECIES: flagellar type III secretion system protein FlhB [unclassified Massilia]QNA88222.1 flagellar type III secretion system protein FlhB [Massilia sp. Dwa41.01b]QNA99121.1 flagellar type III secretion system protein FlhB [Massilia sp. Se16.2.3]
MAEGAGGDKTEKASAQKLRKAREEGQVVRSKDLSTAIGVLVSLKLFVLMVPTYLESFRALFRLVFVPLGETGAMENAMSVVFMAATLLLVKMVLPLAAVPVAIVIGGLVPGGWVMSGKNLMPKMSRLNPMTNLGNLVSQKHAIGLATSIAKAVVLGIVLVHVMRSSVSGYVELQRLPLGDAILRGSSMMFDALMALVAVFVIFAVLDVPIQAFQFAKNQRMSKQEQKEEHKTSEGRPEVKQRIRQLQHQLARRSVNKTVPTADVVIVNPEHYAVALKYDTDRAEAPYVVAKGVDEMALYIKRVAAQHKVETLTLPPLARAIYNTSQVQQQIPAQLYQAVSQVLNYVLQLNAFRDGRRQAPPRIPTDVAVPHHLSEVTPS